MKKESNLFDDDYYTLLVIGIILVALGGPAGGLGFLGLLFYAKLLRSKKEPEVAAPPEPASLPATEQKVTKDETQGQ